MSEGGITYVPPIRGFTDTGYVHHAFSNDTHIEARVVPSNNDEGYSIALSMRIGDQELCGVELDRLTALAIVDVLVKNIMNQEEVVWAEREKILNKEDNNGN